MIARIKGFGKKKSTEAQPAQDTAPKVHSLPINATISYGGWHPRTAMHLSELYTFLSEGESSLPLSKSKLTDLHQSLNLQSVAREVSYMEYIRATTNDGLEIRYFEDGLYIIELQSRQPQIAAQNVINYHNNILVPALHYLFSIGAPISELSHIHHPRAAVVWLSWPHHRHFEIDESYGKVLSQVTSDDVTAYKTENYTFVVSSRQGPTLLSDLIEMHIFFNEFQSHLEQFLLANRQTWSELNKIRERPTIKHAEIPSLHRLMLKQQHIINVARGRLDQMNAFIQSRAAITDQLQLEEYMLMLFHHRFETLEDSYHYLVRNWQMSKEYLDQTANLLATLQARSTTQLLSSQRFILILLTVSTMAIWLNDSHVLNLDQNHLIALFSVLAVALGLGWIAQLISNQNEYRIKLKNPTKPKTPNTSKSKKK